MRKMFSSLKRSLSIGLEARKTYRALQKHFDTMPIGYPPTITGVELRILQDMFTRDEAEAVLHITWQPETFSRIFERAGRKGYTEEKLQTLLDSMESKGCVFTTMSGDEKRYAWHPLIVGMYEMQIKRLTPGLYLDVRNYNVQAFTMEYLTSEVRQMRVIPVRESVEPELAIAPYDDIREIVDRADGRIGLADCICKKAKDSLGMPCRVTDRREVCIGFRDFHDMYDRNGWDRSISKKEAFEILDQNEKDGLVLMPTSLQDPQFVCSCCSCCCGIMEMVSILPRTADFVGSNYRASLNPDTCRGCGMCMKRCHMAAILQEGSKASSIDNKKCIGCGLCVGTCPSHSLKLVRKESQFVPPRDLQELYDHLAGNKKGFLEKVAIMSRAMMGPKV